MTNNQKNYKKILFKIIKNYFWNDLDVRNTILKSIIFSVLSKYCLLDSGKYFAEILKNYSERKFYIKVVFKYFFSLILSSFSNDFYSYLVSNSFQIVYCRAHKHSYNHFLNLNPCDFENKSIGQITNIIQRNATAIQSIIRVLVLNFIPSFILMVMAFVNIFFNFGFFLLSILSIFCISYVCVSIYFTNWRHEIKKQMNKCTDDATKICNDGLINYETIFLHGKQTYETNKYVDWLKITEKHVLKLQNTLNLLNFIQNFILALFLMILICSIYWENPNDKKNFLYLFGLGIAFKKELKKISTLYRTCYINIIDIYFIAYVKNDLEIDKFDDDLKIDNLEIDEFNFQNKLKFNKIDKKDFNYNLTILTNKNNKIIIKKGEKIAITGPNGYGKSEFIKKLLKYHGENFNLYIDEINSENLEKMDFKKLISCLPQNSSLFDNTVLFNLSYGNSDISNDEIFKIAKDVGFHEILLNLENGYLTNCGPNGNLLSGGEKQIVAILREIIKSSPIMILDEPNLHLDYNSCNKIISYIKKKDEITVIVIIHNLELIKEFDKVYNIEDIYKKEL